MIEECEEMTVSERFISDAQISQFVGRSKVSHQHLREKTDESKQKDRDQRMFCEIVIF